MRKGLTPPDGAPRGKPRARRAAARPPASGGLFDAVETGAAPVATPGDSAATPGTAPAVPVRRAAAEVRDTLTVSQLTRQIKTLIEGDFAKVSVAGEVSGLRPAASGHLYFSLKDAGALIDVVMWRSSAARLAAMPRDGDRVVAHGELSVYEPRGRYQLVAARLEAEGKGDRQRQLEILTERLRLEGLFDPARKRPLPAFPRVVGLATSATGAVLRDVARIFRRRAPWVRLVLAPARVQGEGAAEELVAALDRLARFGGCDAVVVGRGGGSVEDLWAFNDETLARTLAAYPVPVVSAVGHETDVTLADFAADVRAATPSEAAELLAPDREALERRERQVSNHLARGLALRLRLARERLAGVAGQAVWRRPETWLTRRRLRWDEAAERLGTAARRKAERCASRLATAAARLEALSPLAVLSRGYAVAFTPDGRAVKAAADAPPGTVLRLRLSRDELLTRVLPSTPEVGEDR